MRQITLNRPNKHGAVRKTDWANPLAHSVAADHPRKTPDGEVLASSDDVAAYLVQAAGVVTASGVGFMQDGFLRLSFATPEEDIISGMRAVRQAFEALQ